LKAAGSTYGIVRYLLSFVTKTKGWISTLVEASVVAVVYFVAARLGLTLLSTPSDVAVFWPASGIAAGVLILSGRRALLAVVIGVIVGTVAANVISDRSVLTSLCKGFCNAGEAVLVAWLLERLFGPAFSFADLRHVLGFLTAAAVASAASAIGGATTITLLHTKAPFWDVWRVWLLSDGIGIVVVAPLFIEFSRALRELPSRRETIEGSVVLSILGLVSAFVYAQPSQSWISFDPDAFALPLLLWLAARWSAPFAITGAFLVCAAITTMMLFGIGHVSDVDLPLIERVRGVQTTVMMVTVFTLVLVALFAERRRTEETLKQSKDRLQLAIDGGKLGTFSANLRTRQFECDVRTALIHGHSTPPATIKESRRFVHGDDLARIDKAMGQASRAGGTWNAEYRVLHPLDDHTYAGETRWVALDASIVRDQQGTPVGLLGVTRDITDRKRAEEHQRTLNAELDHRVKNVLATVNTIAARTLDASSSMHHFVVSLDGRIRSMARTHELLSATQWQGISVLELVRRELAPYATKDNTEINGPDVILKAEAGQAIGMVLHELATNAAKHGALTSQNGRVSIRWQQRLNGHSRPSLVLDWREVGGPSVVTPKNPGFGTNTIRDLIPYEFGGTVDLEFAAAGVQCRVELPAGWLVHNSEPVS
jgi:PAS domain S-box-containing protein